MNTLQNQKVSLTEKSATDLETVLQIWFSR